MHKEMALKDGLQEFKWEETFFFSVVVEMYDFTSHV